jgi:hypothetical protein
MPKRKRWPVFLAVVAFLLGGPASPALSAPILCAKDWICGYQGYSTNTTRLWSISEPTTACIIFSGAQANSTSYISNSTDYGWQVYTGRSCTGTYGAIGYRTHGPMAGIWDNNIEAIQR